MIDYIWFYNSQLVVVALDNVEEGSPEGDVLELVVLEDNVLVVVVVVFLENDGLITDAVVNRVRDIVVQKGVHVDQYQYQCSCSKDHDVILTYFFFNFSISGILSLFYTNHILY